MKDQLHTTLVYNDYPESQLTKTLLACFNKQLKNHEFQLIPTQKKPFTFLAKKSFNRIVWLGFKESYTKPFLKLKRKVKPFNLVIVVDHLTPKLTKSIREKLNPQAVWHFLDLPNINLIDYFKKRKSVNISLSPRVSNLLFSSRVDLREIDLIILKSIQSGKPNKQIISDLYCSESTFYLHLKKLKIFFNVLYLNDTALIKSAENKGYIKP